MKKLAGGFVAAAAALALLFWLAPSRASQSPPQPSPERVTVLLTLGHNATSAERWDGRIRAAGGSLASLQGRHFSAGDAVTGADSWKCAARRDEVAPYADIHYTEMRPGSRPEVLFHPVGLFATFDSPAARATVETAQGNFDLRVSDIGAEPAPFLGGRVTVQQVPSAEKLSTELYQDDEAAIAAYPDGRLAVAWVAYRDRADRIFVRILDRGGWSAPLEATPTPADLFRCSLAVDGRGVLWVIWSQREGERWDLWARPLREGKFDAPVRLTDRGSNTFHRAASGSGVAFVAWQSFRDGQSDIYMKSLRDGRWSPEVRVSESPRNDWEPAVAAGPGGEAHIAWDSYDRGNYDVNYRSWRDGRLTPVRAVTSSENFQAHASVATDAQGRPWIAWDESGVNWGKDQGFLIATPLSVPLHQERTLRIAIWDGNAWQTTARQPAGSLPEVFRSNSEHPQLAFDAGGALTLLFRHWTRRNSRAIGSPLVWENFLVRYDGTRWSAPQPLPSSGGSIEKLPALARGSDGILWAAWMTDSRPFSTMVPGNAEIYAAALGKGAAAARMALAPYVDAQVEAIPVHLTEGADVKAARDYTITAAGQRYKLHRGDMHRHTDVSTDFKYDGSLIEVYRYGLDAASFDYIAPTDHQTGFDQEFTWWQNQKLADLFHVSGAFVPMFAYERSLPFPNGHRNIVFARRGVRTFPIPADERQGRVGAARLFEHLRENSGISMPHSSATAQGTDWRDNDPRIEPLIEIYQGYRTSYEYEGAPRAATTLNKQAQKSGWQPEGFWWKALAKGYTLGVQSSSDHWSTHISYAFLLAGSFTREGLLEAIRKRHAYAATDNIILDFRARAAGREYIMGDILESRTPPALSVRAAGTGAIKQIDIIRNQAFVYTARPGVKQASFEFTDRDLPAPETWYYVRVLQEDGQLAWSSPIWVKK